MTYCSKEDCKLGLACKRHVLNICKEDKKPCKEDLSTDKVFCVIAHCKDNMGKKW